MSEEIPTPRSDAAILKSFPERSMVPWDFARQLERDLTQERQLRAEAERENVNVWKAHGDMFAECAMKVGDLKRELSAAEKSRDEALGRVTDLEEIIRNATHCISERRADKVSCLEDDCLKEASKLGLTPPSTDKTEKEETV